MEDLEGQEAIPTTESEISSAQLIVNIVSLVDEKLDIARNNMGLDVNGYGMGFYHGTKEVADLMLGAVVEHGKSSSNETTEPPAKINPSALEELYDACEKALAWLLDLGEFARGHVEQELLKTLAAALTKAGKK